MQSALFLLAAVACVAFTGALVIPVDEERTVEPEEGDESGIRRLLSDQVCDYGVPYLEQLLEDLSLPKYSSGEATIYNADVTSVEIDGCSVDIDADDPTDPERVSVTASIALSDIYIRITGRYKYKWGWFTFRGNWDLEFNNGYLDVEAAADMDTSTGTPRVTQFTVVNCEDDFTEVDAHFHGSFSAWVINWFRGSISRRLGDLLEDKVCEVGVPYLENELFPPVQ